MRRGHGHDPTARLAPACALITLAGCRETPVAVRAADPLPLDVPIIESVAPVWTDATAWRLADEPRLVLGAP